eukprot:6415433-Pyramimonas_sp.AAC.1
MAEEVPGSVDSLGTGQSTSFRPSWGPLGPFLGLMRALGKAQEGPETAPRRPREGVQRAGK